jgi:hypothetical protein
MALVFYHKDLSMGWVVYSEKSGEILRYYDIESKAQSQVTGHNKKLFWARLKSTQGRDYKEQWAHCNWQDYENIFKKYYEDQKPYMLQKSKYR